jgi:hypothetical protein
MRSSLIAIAFVACSAPSGGIPAGSRLMTGRVHLDDGGATQRRALQLVALYAAPGCGGDVRVGDASPDGAVAACAVFGEPFDPGVDGGGVAELLLPCHVTVNILVQTLGDSGGRSIGDPLALLSWSSGNELTSLLPRELGGVEPPCRDTPLLATNLIDLGELAVPSQTETIPQVELGGPGGGRNPLETVDTDGDGTANLADDDDDGDGVTDELDDDDDGDGAADAAQSFSPGWLG